MEYTLRYLPIAKQDLSEAINFILNEYQNPVAAENTLDRIEKAIQERLKNGPESFAIWQWSDERNGGRSDPEHSVGERLNFLKL